MKDLKKHSITSGTFTTVAMRWTDRLIGLISTLILARLLMPEDFGIIAMASLVIGFTVSIFDIGINVALIQNHNADQSHYDSAWTLRLLQSSIITALLFFLATYIADYFHDERVKPVLQILSFSILLGSLENIGVITFQKNMQFGAEFRFLFIKRIAGFITTITFAILLESYWALVIGTLVGRSIGVLISYTLHPMRPHFSFKRIKELLSVSQWMLLRSIGEYLNNNIAKFLVGHNYSSTIMGRYSLASEISAMPTAELLAPLNRVLFPAFSKEKGDAKKFKKLFLLAQSIQVLIAVPAAVGLALVAKEAVPIMLGEKWMPAVPFIQVLALVSVTHAIGTSSGYVLLVLGKFKASVINNWLQITIFLMLFVLLPTESTKEAIGFAYLQLIASILGLISIFYQVIRAFPTINTFDLIKSTIRPLLGVIAMYFILVDVSSYIELSLWTLLITKIILGGLTYIFMVILLWWLMGMPDGAEKYLFDRIHRLKRDKH